jgi:hypothetical protein
MARAKFDSTKDYYAELGLNESAGSSEIERAYREAARERHPDHGGSEEAMKLLNEAHDVLSDPELRRSYDLERLPSSAAAQPAASFDPYAASKSGTLGIPVSDPDFAGLLMGALACFGLGLPLLLLVEMQWVFVLWPLRFMALVAIGAGVYMAHSALRARHRSLLAAKPGYPRARLRIQHLVFWVVAMAGLVILLLLYVR